VSINSFLKLISAGLLLIVAAGIRPLSTQSRNSNPEPDSLATSPLIADTTGMETAWDIPKDPGRDSLKMDKNLAEQIRNGFRLFTDTPRESRFAANGLSCNNCHLNAGQRERAMPLVGISGAYPEYNKRAGRLISLEDRIVECFKRSIDAAGTRAAVAGIDSAPSTNSPEVLSISAYLAWLSKGLPVGETISWRGQNTIPPEKQIPIQRLDPKRGELLFLERCTNCHGEDGQGVEIGDKKPGPLWGNNSWNDGAGAARVYTLAGIFLYAMPYINPRSLTEEEAQQIALYINSKPRPKYPFKEKDYPNSDIPADAVYYQRSRK
jgi:thiosulfate dehydrogenase